MKELLLPLAILAALIGLAYGVRNRVQAECTVQCAPQAGVIRGRDALCYCVVVGPDGRQTLELQ